MCSVTRLKLSEEPSSYPVQTRDLQLPEDVVLSWPLLHIPYQQLFKLFSGVEVWPVTHTFVLNHKQVNK